MQHAFNFTLKNMICWKKHNKSLKVGLFCLYFETKKKRFFCLYFRTDRVYEKIIPKSSKLEWVVVFTFKLNVFKG